MSDLNEAFEKAKRREVEEWRREKKEEAEAEEARRCLACWCWHKPSNACGIPEDPTAWAPDVTGV